MSLQLGLVSASLLLCWALAIQQSATIAVAATDSSWPPKSMPKNRVDFLDANRVGPDIENVESLGRMVKLSTYFDPTDIEALNTKFTIHTRSTSTKIMAFVPNGFVYSGLSDERFHYNLKMLAESGFDSRKRTVILISGFMTGDKIDWLDRVKDLWLKLEDCNVIIVTWKEGNRLVYSRAAATTPRVARQIVVFLHYLASMQGVNVDEPDFAARIHFVGHSLGSHIAGFVGQDLRGQMGRILALDPAGPSFDQFPREHRLDSSDARLVEAIHTNGGKMKYSSVVKSGCKATIAKVMSLLRPDNDIARSIAETFSGEGEPIWFGIDVPVGHLDYFANNGKTQPGCKDVIHLCDHGRSHHIYEGILQHEIDLREAADKLEGVSYKQWRKDKRLLAVNGIDYAGFSSGETLNQLCPAILHDRDRLQGLAEQQMPQCTVPLDQLTPVDELVRELDEQHGVSFDGSVDTSNQRYYFKTLAAEPFAGDHYLLRVKLERSSAWDHSCAIQADLSFGDDLTVQVELHKELRLFSNGKFFGLSLPFVNPNGAKARLALDKMLQEFTIENRNQDKHEADPETEQMIDQVLPSTVTLKITENKSKSTFSKWTKDNQAGPKCMLVINTIQVLPLIGNKRSLFGRYTGQRLSGNSVKLMSHLEYKTRKQAEKIWPDTLTPANQSHERRMQLVVIG